MKLNAEQLLNGLKARWPFAAGAAVLLVLLVSGWVVGMQAEPLGESLGTDLGSAVGMAAGAYKGVEQGTADGGLTDITAPADDQEAAIALRSALRRVGDLEVYAAGMGLTGLTLPEGGTPALMKGSLVFTVDLRGTEIKIDRDGALVLMVPDLRAELYLNEEATEKLAQAQGESFRAGELGYRPWLSSAEGTAALEETVEDFSALRETARTRAADRIMVLTGDLLPEDLRVCVEFQ